MFNLMQIDSNCAATLPTYIIILVPNTLQFLGPMAKNHIYRSGLIQDQMVNSMLICAVITC